MKKWILLLLLAAIQLAAGNQHSAIAKPNIILILADDVGIDAFGDFIGTEYSTPNIDRIASEGALFTDSYAQQSCTAGRASFILGQHPFRTGLLTIGMPGSDHGIPDWAPTLRDFRSGPAELGRRMVAVGGEVPPERIGERVLVDFWMRPDLPT